MVEIKRDCPCCGKTHSVKVKENDYVNYKNGFLVQRAFPYLSSEDREILVSGICGSCWNKIF